MASGAILDFRNLKFLTVGRLRRVESRRRAKFGRNTSNRGQDMAIFFDFSRRRPALGFLKFEIFNYRMAERVEMRRRAKFGRNRSNRC